MYKAVLMCLFLLAVIAVLAADDPVCNAPAPACSAPARWFQLPPIEFDCQEPA
jgi:hypothetical protein